MHLQSLNLKMICFSAFEEGFMVNFAELMRTDEMMAAVVGKDVRLLSLIFSQYE